MKRERELRTWLKKVAPKGSLFWVEPRAGATMGLPDVFCAETEAAQFWLELKVGQLRSDGLLSFSVRADQRKAIQAMTRRGVRVGVLVGFAAGDWDWARGGKEGRQRPRVVVFDPRADVLRGRVELMKALGEDAARDLTEHRTGSISQAWWSLKGFMGCGVGVSIGFKAEGNGKGLTA